MSEEKQIEEMANDLYKNRPYKDLWLEDAEDIAKVLYNEGYRKQSEVIKKFADRLKKYYSNLKDTTLSSMVAYHIDQIAKEMLEG